MLEIKVNVTADDRLVSALENLAAVLGGGSFFSTETKPSVENSAPVNVTEKKTAPPKKETVKAEEVVEVKVEEVDEETTAATTEADEGVPTVTLEDIRLLAKKMIDAGRQAEVKTLVTSYQDEEGNAAKSLTKVRKADYSALFEKLKEAVGE